MSINVLNWRKSRFLLFEKGTKCNSQEYCAYAEGLAYAWDNRRYFTF